ncbi:alanyl-tRNA editing protein [Vibrio pectenicida]|uniref:alanyl-tRNA editing protein n=1 Tax=Vibrio pectenicida TaxID=62763 RepID=UPI003B9A86F3
MPVKPTIISFCHDIWCLSSPVQMVESDSKYFYVITQTTPFHPVSHIWPDHPADRGTLDEYPVIDCQVGAVELSSGQLFVGCDIPVRRDENGWAFVVVHCLEKGCVNLSVGQEVTLMVDKPYQQTLSRGNSAGHMASLALNKVLVELGYWRKDAERKDPHGYCDFNSYAQLTSLVGKDQCVDTYRLGKTLRKRGLNSAELFSTLNRVEEQVNIQLEQWLMLKTEVNIKCCGDSLTDSRYGQCDLGEGVIAEMPCGGTHVRSLQEFKEIRITLTQLDEQNIEMHTHVLAI